MSWFSEIAGKAESFLNTLDKEAGAAITNVVQSSNNRNNSRRQSIKSDALSQDRFSDSASVNQYGAELIDTPEIQSLKTSPSIGSLFSTSTNNINAQQHPQTIAAHHRDDSHSSSASKSSKSKQQHEIVEDQEDGWQTFDFNSSESPNLASKVQETPQETPIEVGIPESANISAAEALEKELTNLQKRYSELMKQHKLAQKKAIEQLNQCTANEKLLKQLQNSESDLKALLESRENQIEGFKLRLQQIEIELKEKEAYLINLKGFNEELQSQLEANGNESRSKENNEMIVNLERELEKAKINFRQEQAEAKKTQNMYREQISRLEDVQQSLIEEIESTKKSFHEAKIVKNELELQLEMCQKRFEALESEHSEFKVKAAKTLMDKDEIIRNLYSQKSKVNEELQGFGSEKNNDDESDESSNENVLKAQCETLVEEVRELQIKYRECKGELDKCQNEIIPRHVYEIRSLEDLSKREKDKCDKLMFEVRTLTECENRSQHDLEQLRTNLNARIAERDEEIEKLRKQLMLKQQRNNGRGCLQVAEGGATPEEWESRLKSLTDNLIQKQANLEQITSANHSLKLQLERTEGRLRELAQRGGSMSSNDVAIGIYHSPTFTNYIKQRMSTGENDSSFHHSHSSTNLLKDYPSDNQMTRRVKRAYNAIDTFSIRAGQFLRRTPGARAVFLVYIAVLHLFVALVLYSYEPEIHADVH